MTNQPLGETLSAKVLWKVCCIFLEETRYLKGPLCNFCLWRSLKMSFFCRRSFEDLQDFYKSPLKVHLSIKISLENQQNPSKASYHKRFCRRTSLCGNHVEDFLSMGDVLRWCEKKFHVWKNSEGIFCLENLT